MTTKNQAMIIGKRISEKYTVYELISTDVFNKEPYTIYSQDFSVFEHLNIGAIVEQHGNNWIEILPYEEHSFEYATILWEQNRATNN